MEQEDLMSFKTALKRPYYSFGKYLEEKAKTNDDHGASALYIKYSALDRPTMTMI